MCGTVDISETSEYGPLGWLIQASEILSYLTNVCLEKNGTQ